MLKVQAGDLNKMGLLYERHKSDLFAYFYRNTNNRTVSEDLVQNTFIRLINSRQQFKGTGQFAYWMYHIARNTWIDNYRKKDPIMKASNIEDSNLKNEWESNEDDNKEVYKKQLEFALQQLNEEKREAIILSRYHGMTYKTIAEICDCTENTVKSRVMRGIKEIKQILKEKRA